MRELKKVKIGNKLYYLDERLKQLRNVKNPLDFINLNNFEVLVLNNLELLRSIFKNNKK
jgi:hypothetical protein